MFVDEVGDGQWVGETSCDTVNENDLQEGYIFQSYVPTAAPAEVIPTAKYLCCGNH